ncbi:type I restriction endonuclease EcoAI subunit S [Propionigenium maris DSM 9537]|uniref:Type I restriction endonuclease EcoAI subunit S n=1 Tax=Propionigenium maris DSM 9537 TaxID=1123000 RepID=A0A9W6LP49_9FUSO|nr:restriction endonuclease subunit S [Propionigenium maris]GLI57318.1 type I restriction endonuclease EcoAI subunit S [Propionigenium maris DSM 9537]
MDFILDNFNMLFDSEENLKKLEEIILDLAVRGKLVPQDESDESASVLLERIEEEKARLIAEKKIKKSKKLEPISEEEIPFNIPDSWEWVRLGKITNKLTDGSHNPPRKKDEGFKMLSAKNIKEHYIDFDESCRLISEEEFEKEDKRTQIQSGDILLNIVGSIGRSAVVGKIQEKFTLQRSVAVIQTLNNPYFLSYLFTSNMFNSQMIANAKGTAQLGIYLGKLQNLILPLPPLSEQNRIVERIDSLKGIIDNLRDEIQTREKTREGLKRSIMAEIEKSSDDKELLKNLELIFQNFDIVVKRKEDIKDIRDLVLSMAVKGKLVPQDSSDEPASVLLERIEEEKARLVAEKKIKRSKKLASISEEEKPFDLPESWEWARLGNVGLFERGKSKHRPRNDEKLFTNGTYPFVQTGDVARSKSNGYVIENYSKTYNEFGLEQSRLWKKGTFCITIAANIAEVGFLGIDACFPDSVVGFISLSDEYTPKYVKLFFQLTQKNIESFAPATAQKNINLGIINQLTIPLPPLAEQKRIVQRVDKLMELCDRLEEQVEKSQREMEALMGSVMQL